MLIFTISVTTILSVVPAGAQASFDARMLTGAESLRSAPVSECRISIAEPSNQNAVHSLRTLFLRRNKPCRDAAGDLDLHILGICSCTKTRCCHMHGVLA